LAAPLEEGTPGPSRCRLSDASGFLDGNVEAPLKDLVGGAHPHADGFLDGNVEAPLKHAPTVRFGRTVFSFLDGNVEAPSKLGGRGRRPDGP